MGYKNNQQMLETLEVYIRNQVKAESADQLVYFAKIYFSYAAFEEVSVRSIEDLYGAMLAQWNQFLELPTGGQKIHIYNPTVEEHGWQSPHTVIEILIPDMAFILQSVTMEINRYGFANQLVLHPIYWVERSEAGKLKNLSKSEIKGAERESILHIEIDRQSDPAVIAQLKNSLLDVLSDVRAATDDWSLCVSEMQSEIKHLKAQKNPNQKETIEFLEWIQSDHFVFLGFREYVISEKSAEFGFSVKAKTGLGILRDEMAKIPEGNFLGISAEAYAVLNTDNVLMLTNATSKSTVHRSVFMDYIGIKQYNKEGVVVGEKRFLGLYSSSAYSCELKTIPLVREKIQALMQRSEFINSSHTARSLLFVLSSLPRDELFQAQLSDLFEYSLGVLQLQERQRVRVFVRHDIYGHFVSLLIFVPRERYNTESRKKIQQILVNIFKGEDTEFSINLTESILARIHFVIHSKEGCSVDYDVAEIEQRIVQALSNWNDELSTELHFAFGEAEANSYLQAYSDGFSAAYRESISPRTALLDLKRFDKIEKQKLTALGVLYSPLTAVEQKQLFFKLYCFGGQASLSRSLPILENMGVKVCSENPYEIKKRGQDKPFWIHDFGLEYTNVAGLNLETLKPNFQEAFEQCWAGNIENDGFNALVIQADLSWRDVNFVRAFYFYLRQIGIAFSQSYVERTLVENGNVVRLLVQLFYQRFSGAIASDSDIDTCVEEVNGLIEQVKSLDEDRILRRYLNLILAAERTSFFNNTVDEKGVPYFSTKFKSEKISEIPFPVPYYEIFVYSPRLEGVHLRGGAVARGGLRWSDRREDFRTEVLGLMKAQMTKNSVIVPTGAKGGFVVKTDCSKEGMAAEGLACYHIFIRGLLEITDTYKADVVIKPEQVTCYDDDDPYLVVAADKGTARFSDYANALSKEYNFWLDDAFASGGSVGYDHKEMGITAKGAWVSVQHHFGALGVDIQKTPFTVVGIGSMVGDVFGNGMMLSKQIKLVAAFDHESIFLDPTPNMASSFVERERLFNLPRSGWGDYDHSLISAGGGVYSRQEKEITLSDEVKEVLGIKAAHLTPNELIKAILCAPVDLLWNGGIGTYVKAENELNVDVGDRANDSLRINGVELRCKVVGEGGNLGFTQSGRIEYAQQGGYINTDSIDNSAGVDCSDHEVNIKILLNSLLAKGDMTTKQRDKLLASMTDQVAELVLKNNYAQNNAISMIKVEATSVWQNIKALIAHLETNAHLDCALEKLPNEKEMRARKTSGQGLMRPEISVLLAYTKQLLKTELLAEAEHVNLNLYQCILADYFPEQLQSAYADDIQTHRLAKEIAANQLINSLVNRLGIVFPYRFMKELSCSAAELVNTYNLVCRVFEIDTLWQMQSELDGEVAETVLNGIKLSIRKWVERAMYWFVRNEPNPEDAEHYVDSIAELTGDLNRLVTEHEQKQIDKVTDDLLNEGVSADLALKIAQIDVLFSCLNAVKVHEKSKYSLQDMTAGLFYQASHLNLGWVLQQILLLPKENSWEALSRRAMLDEYHQVSCVLLKSVFREEGSKLEDKLNAWQEKYAVEIERYSNLVNSASSDDDIQLDKIVVILGASWNMTAYA
ncbi:MAG: NAD-glutamate dehydrogenase [Methyloprofundus sp.]|nr:NAD-glutamate dehydrogenase [Methyloprofundus sp.]